MTMGWPGVVALMALESTCVCVPIPSEAVMPLAGWMLIRDQGLGWEHTLLAGLYGGAGCTAGSLIAYAGGRWWGRALLMRFGRYVLVTPEDIATADRWFARHGDWAIFLSRMVPLVRTVISVPAGIVRVPLARFTALTFAGSTLWCWALAIGGYMLGEHWEQMREVTRPFDLPIIGAFVIFGVVYVYKHVRHKEVTS